MTTDEQIQKLAESQVKTEQMLAGVVEALGRLEQSQAKTERMLVGMMESIGRLERIAGVLLINDEELDRRLSELERRAPRKPQ